MFTSRDSPASSSLVIFPNYQPDIPLRSMSEKFQAEKPNQHYLLNLDNLNQTNNAVHLSRLPTLGEILSNKTRSPVNLYTFYLYMQYIENNVDLLDFWFDLISHLNLCKHYVKGLRESIVRSSNHYASGTPFMGHDQSPRNLGAGSPQRDSFPLTEGSKHKSVSLSMLLDLIINDHILEDNDSNRLSQFLRGEINLNDVDPKIRELIDKYQDDGGVDPPSPIVDNALYGSPGFPDKRVSSNSKLLDDSFDQSNTSIGYAQLPQQGTTQMHHGKTYASLRRSSINPSLLEKIIRDSKHSSGSFITRNNLRESSHNLLLKYFVEDSEKNLNLPTKLNNYIINAIEVEGRDDPDVFNAVKRYVFNVIESHYLPNFLNFVAIKNVNRTINARIIIGFFFIFASFWIAFTLIFLDLSKGYRAVIVVSFLIGFYCLVSSVYRLDPLLALAGFSESFIPKQSFIKVHDRFIYRLLLKRSLWVLALILLFTAILTIVFCLVPGRRL